ncbi:hypothetical protein BRADI_1g59130v3 [Brachypodium distachyon]|uniref:3'-5' exonuclease domain-containing protein n=1 Tax=Brachypodium distachyon TaxID=15368 RepID=A0A0Q3NUN0_BRADI|nr:hypothetical protein BRADI_1g59130v3 [Brachypodium distachyon]
MDYGGGRTGPATLAATRLRRSTESHDAYTVRIAYRRLVALATATPADARRWICTTRWLHASLLRSGRLVIGLGVQWTPVRGPLPPNHTPPPATLQLCAGHRCLVFHLAQLDSPIPAALYRFLADPRVLCVGYGSAYDRRMLLDHFGLRVASGRDLRALAGMGGNVSVEEMAARFLGFVGVRKPREVAMSAWHRPRLDAAQVEYAAADAYLAFRLGVLLCSGEAAGHHHHHHQQPAPPAPVIRRAPPPAAAAAPRAPPRIVHEPLPPGPRVAVLNRAPAPAPAQVPPRAPVVRRGPQLIVHAPLPPGPRVAELRRAPAPAQVLPRAPPRAPVVHHAPAPAQARPRATPTAPRAVFVPRAPAPAPRALVIPCPPPVTRAPEQQPALAPTAVVVDAADGSSSKTAETHPAGVTGSLTTGGGGLPMIRSSYASSDSDDGLPMIRSSYSPGSEDSDFCSDDFELLGREAVTNEDEEEQQHISDYLAGFLSDGEYVVDTGVPIDDNEEDGVVEEYTGMGVLTVRDHIAEGYKEYTGILTVRNDTDTTYNDNDDEAFVVGSEEPEYYSVVGGADCYGNSTAEAFNGGEDDGYYCQDGGSVWYDQGDDGDRYVQDDDSYDAFY